VTSLVVLTPILFFVSAWVVAEAWDPAPARRRAATTVQALLAAAASTALILYVASEDDYRDTGVSRWEAYDAEAMTVVAALAGAIVCAGALVEARRRGRRALVLVGAAGIVAAVLLFLAFAANSLN
jgi:drug/metabolite transporter (DMT)-like permease